MARRQPPKNPTPSPMLKIGDVVQVNAVVNVERSQDWDEAKSQFFGPLQRRIVRSECKPTVMIVVGARRRQLGIVRTASGASGPDWDDYDPGYLKVSETVFVYQVRPGMMRKIVEVLPQDITIDTIRFYGVGATTNVYRCAIYRYSDLARLTSEYAFSTSVDTWGTVISGLNLSLTAGELYFIAVAVNATGTTAGVGCVGGTVAATTGRINTAPESLPGKLAPSQGFVSSYFFQFAVTSGALPDPAATRAAQAAWTGGMPCFFLESP